MLSTPATMPANGVPNKAAMLAASVASPIAPARRPARLRRSRIWQHADTISPVRPASGPTDPPNTIGSKNPTTDLPVPSTRYVPVFLNDAITASSDAGAPRKKCVQTPMTKPPSVHATSGNQGAAKPSTPFAPNVPHSSETSQFESESTAHTENPTTKPAARESATIAAETAASSNAPRSVRAASRT